METAERKCSCGNSLFVEVFEYLKEDAQRVDLMVGESSHVIALSCEVCGCLSEFDVEAKTWKEYAWNGQTWKAK